MSRLFKQAVAAVGCAGPAMLCWRRLQDFNDAESDVRLGVDTRLDSTGLSFNFVADEDSARAAHWMISSARNFLETLEDS